MDALNRLLVAFQSFQRQPGGIIFLPCLHPAIHRARQQTACTTTGKMTSVLACGDAAISRMARFSSVMPWFFEAVIGTTGQPMRYNPSTSICSWRSAAMSIIFRANDHRYPHLQQLAGEIEVALDVGGIDNVDNQLGLVGQEKIAVTSSSSDETDRE